MNIEYADEPKAEDIDFTELRYLVGKITPAELEVIEANRVCAEIDGDLMIVAEFYDHYDEDGSNAEFFVLAHKQVSLLIKENIHIKAQLAALQPQTLLSDGMIECAICQQSISIGCGYRNSDAGTVHDMESDCAANLAFVFDALEKAEAQLATARQDAFAEFRELARLVFDGIHERDKAYIDFDWCKSDSNHSEVVLKEMLRVGYLEKHPNKDIYALKPIPKPPVQLSTEAAQGCECENCWDERRVVTGISDEAAARMLLTCPCDFCKNYRQASSK